jgi:hypothetical protein
MSVITLSKYSAAIDPSSNMALTEDLESAASYALSKIMGERIDIVSLDYVTEFVPLFNLIFKNSDFYSKLDDMILES